MDQEISNMLKLFGIDIDVAEMDKHCVDATMTAAFSDLLKAAKHFSHAAAGHDVLFACDMYDAAAAMLVRIADQAPNIDEDARVRVHDWLVVNSAKVTAARVKIQLREVPDETVKHIQC